jgi:hypothetical protein
VYSEYPAKELSMGVREPKTGSVVDVVNAVALVDSTASMVGVMVGALREGRVARGLKATPDPNS